MKLWKRILLGVVSLLLLAVVAVGVRALYAFRDRNPGYQVDLKIAPTAPAKFSVGFAKVKINPDLSNPAKPIWRFRKQQTGDSYP